jgi:hypothetical protein
MLLLLKSATSGGAGAASYPLDDDGTLAAAFGFGWLETDAPDYHNADYTYLAPATGNLAAALPTAANAWTSQAIVVDTGTILACEAVINSVSAAQFANLGIAAAASSGGTPSGVAVTNSIDNNGSPRWLVSGTGGTRARSGATSGYRVGIELNGNDGTITMRSSDGSALCSTTFTPGTAFTFYLFITDAGTPAAGQTASITLVPVGADMQLGYSAGTTDFNGDACPQTAAVWNPYFSNARVGFSNANLRATLLEVSNWSSFGSTGVILPGEKKCFGIIVGTAGNTMIGFGNSSASVVDNQFLGFTADAVGFFNAGQVYWNGSGSTYTPSWTSGDFILLAINRVDNEVTLYKNGVAAATISIPAVTGDLIPMASFEGLTGRYIDGYFDPDTFPNAAPTGYTGVTT